MHDVSVLRIQPAGALTGKVWLPGDKSLSHRALILSSLSDGVSRIGNCLVAGVTEAMIDCLEGLGVKIKIETDRSVGDFETAEVSVHGCGLRGFARPAKELNCRGSATTMRLLAGVLAGQPFQSTLDGNDRLRLRPMDRVIEPLREKGARIETKNGNAPLTFLPSVLKSSEHVLSVASAQVKSALLLAGLFCEGPTTVVEPHVSRDHTERMLRNLGIGVTQSEDGQGRHVVTMSGGIPRLPAMDLTLASDPSSAAFLTVAGLLVPGSSVQIPNLCLNPGRAGLFEVLQSMEADLDMVVESDSTGEPVGTVDVRASKLHGVEIKGPVVTRMIDEFPILAVAATQASGATVVSDAQELKLKESDRIQALAEELNKMGAGIQTLTDGFVVPGSARLQGAVVNARGDHRLAMSLTVAGLVARGETLIHGWEVMRESFPNFPHVLRQMGASVEW
ncbi:MAG: 3-phosphoshikimate 1-carboxyvinyltransferase [Desulfomonile tiedjei]|nr:3-phosphoshikimate 1-carboxyvinyltransferase [Desulfomonile tiedjei]